MAFFPPRAVPDADGLVPPMRRTELLKRLLKAAADVRPGVAPMSARQVALRFLRCARHLDTFRDWFGNPRNPALREALAWRPSLVACVGRPYLHTGWTASNKLTVIGSHYALLRGRLGFLRFAPTAGLTLADAGEGVELRLDKPGWFEHEGELTLNLFQGELRLYSLAFTLGETDSQRGSQRVAYIGALQGSGNPNALEIYRTLTHRMHGLRPRDLLISAFRMLCARLGVERILAISDATRVSSSDYFKSRPKELSRYDLAWTENGGRPVAGGFFELGCGVSPRAPETIPARKRAQYRRRYAMLAAIAAQIGQSVRRAARPQGGIASMSEDPVVEAPLPVASAAATGLDAHRSLRQARSA